MSKNQGKNIIPISQKEERILKTIARKQREFLNESPLQTKQETLNSQKILKRIEEKLD